MSSEPSEDKKKEKAELESEKKSFLWEWGFRILTVLVIPLILWGVKLEVDNAVVKERMKQVKDSLTLQIEECKTSIKEKSSDIGKIRETVTQNYGKLISLTHQLEFANKQLKELKDLLKEMQSGK